MAIVLSFGRPSLFVTDDGFDLPANSDWCNLLSNSRAVLSRAIRSVGRIETDDASNPYVGTAFAITPDLVMTANYGSRLLTMDAGSTWINFKAEHRVIEQARVPIVEVVAQSDTSGIALLRLGESLPPDRVATLSKKPPRTLLRGTEICVIGYSGNDARNDAKAVERYFGGIFGVKRLSPGMIMGVDVENPHGTLLHDASVLGGAGGSPLVELETGEVVGLHYAGKYRECNYAKWFADDPVIKEFTNLFSLDVDDPPSPVSEAIRKITKVTSGSMAAASEPLACGELDLPRIIAGAPTEQEAVSASPRRAIFGIDGLLAVNADLVAAGHSSNGALEALFSYLGPDFVAAIPVSGNTPIMKLHSRLSYLNRYLSPYGQNTPFYTVLKTAVAMTGIPDHRKKIEGHLEIIEAFEQQLAES